jgi:hypothetical protein
MSSRQSSAMASGMSVELCDMTQGPGVMQPESMLRGSIGGQVFMLVRRRLASVSVASGPRKTRVLDV